MRRQSKHKHRVTRQMLGRIYARYEWSRLWEKASQAYRRLSDAMAEAYAKARAEREGQV
jgi:hypothetical protein